MRILVRDDEAQTLRAIKAWREALAAGSIFVPKVVFVEAAWVLRSAYRFDAPTIARSLRRLVDIGGVVLENDADVREALERYEAGSADLADYVILESARSARALPVTSFDRRFAEEDDVQLLVIDRA